MESNVRHSFLISYWYGGHVRKGRLLVSASTASCYREFERAHLPYIRIETTFGSTTYIEI